MSAYGPHGGALGPKPTAPKPGDKIVIGWPGGPYDFEMEFRHLDDRFPPPAPGWLWLRGIVGYTPIAGTNSPDVRTLYARPIGPGVYEMVPKPS